MDERLDETISSDLAHAAMDYEHVVRNLWYNRPWDLTGYLDYTPNVDKKPEYADAQFWRSDATEGKLSMVDLGFLDALKSIAHQLCDIRMRLEKLESLKT